RCWIAVVGERERVGEIVHAHEIRIVERCRPDAAEIAHMRAGAERPPEIVTEFSDVGAALAADAEEGAPILDFERRQFRHPASAQPTGDGALLRWFLVDLALELGEHVAETLG